LFQAIIGRVALPVIANLKMTYSIVFIIVDGVGIYYVLVIFAVSFEASVNACG